MSYDSFYRYIYKRGEKYYIKKDNEQYLICNTLEDALYERDRFEAVDWNWDDYVQLVDTINNYIHIDLPPFERKSDYIYLDRECWIVRGHGRRRKYYGTYYTKEEAETVRKIYRANMTHKNEGYKVQKTINGKNIYFGRFSTYEEAEERVKELEEKDWRIEE